MNANTAVVIVKGLVCVGAATISALVGSLAQWSNDGSSPSKIQWIIIIGTSAGSGFTALGGFISSSFGKYIEARTNGNGAAAVPIMSVSNVAPLPGPHTLALDPPQSTTPQP